MLQFKILLLALAEGLGQVSTDRKRIDWLDEIPAAQQGISLLTKSNTLLLRVCYKKGCFITCGHGEEKEKHESPHLAGPAPQLLDSKGDQISEMKDRDNCSFGVHHQNTYSILQHK